MKKMMMIAATLFGPLAYGQESPKTKAADSVPSVKQSESPKQSQGETLVDLSVVDLSDILQNRVGITRDLTGNALKDEKGLCRVHHHVLKKATIPIRYGLMPSSMYSPDKEHGLFPNSMTSVNPGCVVLPDKEAMVLQCEKCLAAKRKWVAEEIERYKQ